MRFVYSKFEVILLCQSQNMAQNFRFPDFHLHSLKTKFTVTKHLWLFMKSNLIVCILPDLKPYGDLILAECQTIHNISCLVSFYVTKAM